MKSSIRTDKIFMTVSLVVAGICGVKVVQEIAIIKYAVVWYFLRLNSEFGLEVESYVYPRLLLVSVALLVAGMLLVTSLWTGMGLLKKSETSKLKKILILVVAVILLAVCGFFAMRYIQDIISQPPFLAQPGWGNLSDEYEIHVASKVWLVALFSPIAGVSLAVSFGLLRGMRKSAPTESSRPEKLSSESLRSKGEPEARTPDLEVLKSRLAKGEISMDDYNEMKALLEGEDADISPLDVL
ncbi:MAG: SHOCT domain-containing protein [Theionarchaea archaeon]|nr:SHOCT domain-containing protein [Theionarchaea archaeon]MBU7037038.1 SHOCT domain-containing protein [Theionarchaea archaeon]